MTHIAAASALITLAISISVLSHWISLIAFSLFL